MVKYFQFQEKTSQKERSCWSKNPQKTKAKVKKSLQQYWDKNPNRKKKLSKLMSGTNNPSYGGHKTDTIKRIKLARKNKK